MLHLDHFVTTNRILQSGCDSIYRGRLAPTPSGLLHAGHARTFQAAWRRAREAGGRLVFRSEDIDRVRCKPRFEEAAREDLAWLGLDWDEGGGLGGPYGPYRQSERLESHRSAWAELVRGGFLFPAPFSRREIAEESPAVEADGTRMFPHELRPGGSFDREHPDREVNWRFRVPDGEVIRFNDTRLGECSFTAGRDFGDFLVWRKEDGPSYELAVVADDHAMFITEVVRGRDLLLSTARQILLYRALGWVPPSFRHEELVCGADGKRLAKTAGSVGIRELRGRGARPEDVLAWHP